MVKHAGVGAIAEADVLLASVSNAIIIGFNVRPDNMARAAAERENVDLRLYRVIYDAIEDVDSVCGKDGDTRMRWASDLGAVSADTAL